jgi:Rrf2 family protein
MKLASNEEYGLRCLLRLAQGGDGASLTIPEISSAEGISQAYVAKLLRTLRRGGFVKAARGNVGGYRLSQPASQIVLGRVMDVLGGRLFESNFCEAHSGQAANCVRSTDCSVRVLWSKVQAAIDRVLDRTTLDDLLRNESQMITWLDDAGGFAASRTRVSSGRQSV